MSRFVTLEAMFSVPTSACGRCQATRSCSLLPSFLGTVYFHYFANIGNCTFFYNRMSLCRLVMLHYCMHILHNLVKHELVSAVCMRTDGTSGSNLWLAFRKWFSVFEFLRICVLSYSWTHWWHWCLSLDCVSVYTFVSFHVSRQGLVNLKSAGQKVFNLVAGSVVYNIYISNDAI